MFVLMRSRVYIHCISRPRTVIWFVRAACRNTRTRPPVISSAEQTADLPFCHPILQHNNRLAILPSDITTQQPTCHFAIRYYSTISDLPFCHPILQRNSRLAILPSNITTQQLTCHFAIRYFNTTADLPFCHSILHHIY